MTASDEAQPPAALLAAVEGVEAVARCSSGGGRRVGFARDIPTCLPDLGGRTRRQARHPCVSTRCGPTDEPRERASARPDPAEEVALVARARRELLLRAHRHRLRREDLEDCYSQATLELLADATEARGLP